MAGLFNPSTESEFRSPLEKKPKIEYVDEQEKSDGSGSGRSTVESPSIEGSGGSASSKSEGSVGPSKSTTTTCASCLEGFHPSDCGCGCDVCKELVKMEEDDEADFRVSHEDAVAYKQQVDQSGGYDVDYFHGVGNRGGIQPCFHLPEFCTRLVNHAIQVCNENNAAQIQFVKIIKVNTECCSNPHAYITFEAKDGVDCRLKIYQTRVRITQEGDIVEEVRLKPEVD